jgi:hypothetical protein
VTAFQRLAARRGQPDAAFSGLNVDDVDRGENKYRFKSRHGSLRSGPRPLGHHRSEGLTEPLR